MLLRKSVNLFHFLEHCLEMQLKWHSLFYLKVQKHRNLQKPTKYCFHKNVLCSIITHHKNNTANAEHDYKNHEYFI